MFSLSSLAYALFTALTIVLAGGVLFYSSLVLWNRNKYKHLPSPKPVSFFFGHVLLLRNAYKRNGHMFDLMTQWAEDLGSVYVIYFFHTPWVVIWNPEAVKELLATETFLKPPAMYDTIGYIFGIRFIGNGLATDTNHARWIKKRHGMNPAFNKSALAQLVTEFNNVVDQLMKSLGNFADRCEIIELGQWFHRTALGIICRVAFAKDVNCFGKHSPFNTAVTDALHIFGEALWDPTLMIPLLARSRKVKFSKSVKYIKDTGMQWVKERELAVQNDEYVPDDILNQLVKMKEMGLYGDYVDLMDDFITFFVAGHETTANALSFTMMEAGRHPEVLKRMHDEVDEVLGKRPDITVEDINKLEYINAVWKESLRLHPIAPMTSRDINCDGFKIGGLHIPKGSIAMMSPYISGRMPSLVQDPLDFKPERFLAESPERPNTYGYFPFSLGPRNCIGQNFANLEGKIIIAKFLQNFTMDLDFTQSFDVVDCGVLRPKDNVRVKISWRKNI